MSSIVNKIKEKTTGKTESEPKQQQPTSEGEQTFSIQPHPAQTNDPRDLEAPQPGGGLSSNPEYGAFKAREPHVPSPQIANNLPPAASREEMRARAAELNRE
ncbi:uncharacterized protein BXZ73DRAFT_80219 [Epithele typhae]|uniref:uncharacterized protein n=1 Tax=Epithele typhae TaxID=378194 RepID=UPI002008C3D0|nr:uncharacterized protein BXZ73DRAFT_80219 [Epithele typhae]KAH9919980.1 hypothetical protein BXZ73DRAFT_80219 [Epithele typhae]